MSAGINELETMRDAAYAQLAGLLALSGPTATTAGGEVPWTPWLAPLQACIDWCDRKLAEGAPYEVASRGVE